MRIVGTDERLQGFGICFLCQDYISIGEGQNIAINTGYEFDPDFQSPLVGDKYCCGSCARALADTMGWVSPDAVKELKQRALSAEQRLQVVTDSVKSLNVGLYDIAAKS